MKIALIGPGIMPIPPTGWGGVEHLIWNYSQQLQTNRPGSDAHSVTIINTPNLQEIIDTVNEGRFDAVHLHYDQFAAIMPRINCHKKLITSHYPYLEEPEPQYVYLYELLNSSDCHIVSLSDRIKDEFVRRGIAENKISVLPCGIDTKEYALDDEALYPDRSIVVGKIDVRKRQHLLQTLNLNIDFIGNCADPNFDTSDPHYLGEQSKRDIMDNLTAYANMVLLSKGEAHPFVCLEAMAAGLGLVISEQSTANLDLSQPFITVISDEKCGDYYDEETPGKSEYLREKIEENRKISLGMRKEIREYCRANFDWENIIPEYIRIIDKLD